MTKSVKRIVCIVRHGARTPLVDASSHVLGLTEWNPEVCLWPMTHGGR